MAFSPGCMVAWGEGFGAQPLGGPVQLTASERQKRLVQAGGGSAHKALDGGSIPINDRSFHRKSWAHSSSAAIS